MRCQEEKKQEEGLVGILSQREEEKNQAKESKEGKSWRSTILMKISRDTGKIKKH